MALYLVTDDETEISTLVEAYSQESARGKVVNDRYSVRTITDPAEGVKLYSDGARWFDADPSRESLNSAAANEALSFPVGKPIDEENISEEFDEAFRNTDDCTLETEDEPEEAEAAE